MRLAVLIRGNIRFQYKYGFYYLYLLLCLIYAALISAFPDNWREKAAVLMIFSDPAAMGLYFMGALVLYEKSERVLESFSVSPAGAAEYTAAKLISIGVISTAAGVVIGLAGSSIKNAFYFVIGVFLCSCLFSAAGLMLAANISTLNGFIIATIPAELIINVPAICYLFGWKPGILILHPGVCLMELCLDGPNALPAFLILACWTVLLTWLTCRVVKNMLRSLGGVKL